MKERRICAELPHGVGRLAISDSEVVEVRYSLKVHHEEVQRESGTAFCQNAGRDNRLCSDPGGNIPPCKDALLSLADGRKLKIDVLPEEPS